MNLLLRVRKALFLNQTEMGERLGLTRQSIYLKETGQTPLTKSERLILEVWDEMHVRKDDRKPRTSRMYIPAYTDTGKPIFEPYESLQGGRDRDDGPKGCCCTNSGEDKQ